jgi:hypothetical protein
MAEIEPPFPHSAADTTSPPESRPDAAGHQPPSFALSRQGPLLPAPSPPTWRRSSPPPPSGGPKPYGGLRSQICPITPIRKMFRRHQRNPAFGTSSFEALQHRQAWRQGLAPSRTPVLSRRIRRGSTQGAHASGDQSASGGRASGGLAVLLRRPCPPTLHYMSNAGLRLSCAWVRAM